MVLRSVNELTDEMMRERNKHFNKSIILRGQFYWKIDLFGLVQRFYFLNHKAFYRNAA